MSAGSRPVLVAAWVTSLVAAVLVLWTALAPGLVLGYDMVFTPDQPLTPRSVGIDAQLPRAVPVDAVVAALDEVVPASLLQKAVLLGALTCAGGGCGLLAGRLAARSSRSGAVAAVVAAAAAVVNPYVVQRLTIGHWSLLVGYAVLPWLVHTALRLDRAGRAPVRAGAVPLVVLLLALAALTPTGGLLALLVGGASLVAVRAPRRAWAVIGGAAVILNAPWWVPALLHPAAAASGAGAGVAQFAVRSETVLGPFVSAAGLGGIWNGEVVTPSRGLVAVQLVSLVVLGVALLGAAQVRSPRAVRLGLVLTSVGVLLALASSVPGVGVPAVTAVVETVPGGGLLRDAHKWLALVAPVLAVATGLGVAHLAGLSAGAARRAGREPVRAGRPRSLLPAFVAGVGVLLVVGTIPDGLLGVGGRLRPVTYPADWRAVADALADEPAQDTVLALPFQPFRRFAWTGDRTVLDPAPRWFAQQVVTEDRLTVGTTTLPGESSWADRVRSVLERDGSAQDLAATGVEWVLVEKGTPGTVPGTWREVADPVVDGDDLALYRLPQDPSAPAPADPPRPPAGPVLLADGAALAVVLAAAAAWFVRRRRVPASEADRAMLLSSHRDRSGRH